MANLSNTKEGVAVMRAAFARYPSLEAVCGDAGYRGTFVDEMKKLGLRVDIVERLGSTWELLPKQFESKLAKCIKFHVLCSWFFDSGYSKARKQLANY